MTKFRLKAAGLSHTGHVRSANEDAMALRPEVGLWAVADGMGGLQHGQWASQQVIALLTTLTFEGGDVPDVERIGHAILEANEQILAAARESGSQMGTTVAALRIWDSRFVVVWAGDSRAYLCRRGKLVQLTRDHTQVQELVEAGLIAAENAKHHPNGHILSRAIGVEHALQLDAVTDEVEAQDIFLLCSDGLTCVVSDPEIAERLSIFPPETAARRLVELALARGAPDNVTVIAIACEEKTLLTISAETPVNA